MILAVTGYAFNNHILNGGHGLKIGIIRAQAAKIAIKTVRESTRQEDGSLKYNGDTQRLKKSGENFRLVLSRVIEEKGCNDFLSGSQFHFEVRREYVVTKKGIVPSRSLKGRNAYKKKNNR